MRNIQIFELSQGGSGAVPDEAASWRRNRRPASPIPMAKPRQKLVMEAMNDMESGSPGTASRQYSQRGSRPKPLPRPRSPVATR